MKVIGWIVAVPLIFFGLFVALRFAFCRPNYFVVKTATPVAERIADYIVEHGLPERLDAIPGLPYELKGCTRKEVYWKDHQTVKDKSKANWMELYYSCIFFDDNSMYKIDLRFLKSTDKNDWEGKIRIASGKTHIGISIETDPNKKLTKSSIHAGFSKSGICKQFKQ